MHESVTLLCAVLYDFRVSLNPERERSAPHTCTETMAAFMCSKLHTSSCLVRARNRRWQTNIFNLICATRKKGNYVHVTSMFLAWLMPHLYFTKTSRACSCIASGSEQTVAFIAAGSSGLRSLRVPLERCVGWGGSNFICKFQYTISVCFGRLFLVCICLFDLKFMIDLMYCLCVKTTLLCSAPCRARCVDLFSFLSA